MRPVLLITTAVLAVVSVTNLTFTMGVVRRLREHSDALVGMDLHRRRLNDIGRRVEDFSVVTLSGSRFARAGLPDRAVVAFLLPGCAGCERSLPEFVSRLAGAPGADAVTAVVIGDPADSAEMIARLRTVVDVVGSDDATAVAEAFDAKVYPTFYVIDRDGTVLDSGPDIPVLAETVLGGAR